MHQAVNPTFVVRKSASTRIDDANLYPPN